MTAGEARLYYEARGDGAPILGIHGTPSSTAAWADAAERLAARGRCITYDRRGFRHSAPHPMPAAIHLDEHVADAVALLEALDAAPAVVIGRSTGGLIALELARRRPAALHALVLLEPAVFSVDAAAQAWADRLRHAVLRAAARDGSTAAEVVIREGLGHAVWASWPESVRRGFADASPAVLAEIHGRGLDLSDEPLRLADDDLRAIRAPTLIASSEGSPEAFRRVDDRLAAAIPGAEHVVVAGGHLIDPAHDVVLAFLDRVLPPREKSRSLSAAPGPGSARARRRVRPPRGPAGNA